MEVNRTSEGLNIRRLRCPNVSCQRSCISPFEY